LGVNGWDGPLYVTALIAQINGVSLDISQIAISTALSVIVSVGTAPISNAGMVYLTVLLDAAGLGEYAEQALATLFVVDWIVNRIEVAVNVTSDQMVARIIHIVTSKDHHGPMSGGCCVGRRVAAMETSTTKQPPV